MSFTNPQLLFIYLLSTFFFVDFFPLIYLNYFKSQFSSNSFIKYLCLIFSLFFPSSNYFYFCLIFLYSYFLSIFCLFLSIFVYFFVYFLCIFVYFLFIFCLFFCVFFCVFFVYFCIFFVYFLSNFFCLTSKKMEFGKYCLTVWRNQPPTTRRFLFIIFRRSTLNEKLKKNYFWTNRKLNLLKDFWKKNGFENQFEGKNRKNRKSKVESKIKFSKNQKGLWKFSNFAENIFEKIWKNYWRRL